eukprot:m.111889 g.111889  ORF g.111889 m.111889 type:complete len:378 (+) comp15961_c0_seq3:1-1134(+)
MELDEKDRGLRHRSKPQSDSPATAATTNHAQTQQQRQRKRSDERAADKEDDDEEVEADADDDKYGPHSRPAGAGGANNSDDDLLSALANSFVVRYCIALADSIRQWLLVRRNQTHRDALDGSESKEPQPHTLSALAALDAARGVPFVAGHDSHEHMLVELWGLLRPETPFERMSKNWGDIGFQGKDPATDFRGQGILALRNLVYFCRTYTREALDIMDRCRDAFPFAVCAVNISSCTLELVKKYPAEIGNSLFEGVLSSEEVLEIFDQLFSIVFRQFEAFHLSAITAYLQAGGNPAFVIMEFGKIRKQFFDALDKQVRDGSFNDEYIDRCSSAAALPQSSPAAVKVEAGAAVTVASQQGQEQKGKPEVAVGNLIDLS